VLFPLQDADPSEIYLKFLKLSLTPPLLGRAHFPSVSHHHRRRKQIPSFGTFKLPRVRMATAQKIFLFSFAKSPKVRRRGAIFKPLERIIISHSIDSAPNFAFSSSRLAWLAHRPRFSIHCGCLACFSLAFVRHMYSVVVVRNGTERTSPLASPRTRPRLLFESSGEFQGVFQKGDGARWWTTMPCTHENNFLPVLRLLLSAPRTAFNLCSNDRPMCASK
jgi:hypothetical protein